jgi:creatinine amidohydrolase
VPALALPALAIGHSPEHAVYPGTLTAAPETLLALGRDVAGSLHRAGVRRLVLFTAHGGNPPVLELLAVELRTRLGMLVALPALWGADGLPAGLVVPEEVAYGIHGGTVETALVLHLRPDLVRTGRAGAFASAAAGLDRAHRQLRVHGRNALGWASQDLNPSGAVGDAGAADGALGKRILDHAAGALATLVEELHRLPADWLKDGPL